MSDDMTALELWVECFREMHDFPYYYIGAGYHVCFFCGAMLESSIGDYWNKIEHYPDCIYIRAWELADRNIVAEQER